MKRATYIAILAIAVSNSATAGGLVMEPSLRPAMPALPLPANRCQHIPWTECGVVRDDSDNNNTTVVTPEQPPVIDKPDTAPPDKPTSPTDPCKRRKLGDGSVGGC